MIAVYVAAVVVAAVAVFFIARSVMLSMKIGQRTPRQVAFGDAVSACLRDLRHAWGPFQINFEKFDVDTGRYAEIEALWTHGHRLSFRLDDFDYDVLEWSNAEWKSGYAQFATELEHPQSDVHVIAELRRRFAARSAR